MMCLCFIAVVNAQIIRKSPVQFYSDDSLLITANHYYSDKNHPYILLFHTENSSRGEFDSIATKFARMNYNCLAVDLRSGDKYEFVENETAIRAREKGLKRDLYSGRKDIQAAIDFAWKLSGKEMILLGSSSSASLVIIEAKDDDRIQAVMAFSPGEFFGPEIILKQVLENFSKPLFVSASSPEVPYMEDMFINTNEANKSFFVASRETSIRGTGVLTRDNPSNPEYWFSVLIFIKSLQT